MIFLENYRKYESKYFTNNLWLFPYCKSQNCIKYFQTIYNKNLNSINDRFEILLYFVHILVYSVVLQNITIVVLKIKLKTLFYLIIMVIWIHEILLFSWQILNNKIVILLLHGCLNIWDHFIARFIMLV